MLVPLPELTDWQYELGGVLMGAGTPVQVMETTGLGRPPVRDNDADQPSMDGAFAGPDYYAARQVQFDAAVRIPGDPAACHDVVAALQASADDPLVRLGGGVTMPLRIKRPGRPVKVLNGRLRRVDPEFKQVIHGYVPLDLEFIATDPTYYADEETTTEIPLGWLTGGGFAAPVVAPIFVQSGTTAADRPGWVTNQGTTPAWPVIRITGPVATVTVTHVASGRQLSMPTLNLTSSSQWVEVDTRPGYRAVRRENGGNASTLLSPSSRVDLFSLPPGQSEMRWTGFDNTNTARMRLTWRDAYTAL
ncbi:phage tail domain-containing protein [Streptomyces sp. ML-6]|uniref:phage tail domain-containing protein n=1 Tax=Streptomyces sp. ML-6 TaxID=2982693 RepID=UPI0024BF4B7A|nr:phage tail domain-containing protein [Streptomyces sp. ML-6]MDK0525011.1 phage tail family protein [Streptomyces sp. ML-6]